MRKTVYVVMLLCCLGLPAPRGFPADDGMAPEARGLDVPARRDRSMFHRAQKKTASEQLQYARKLRDAGRRKKACRQYLALVHTWHGSPEAPVAQAELAQVLESRGLVQNAFVEYQYLVDNYAGSFDYETVLKRQFEIASNLMKTPSRFLWVFGSTGNLEDALPLFEQVAANGPGSSYALHAYFNVAVIYEKTGEYDLAIDAYEAVRQRFPGDALSVDSAFREGNCLYRLTTRRKYDEYSIQVARGHLDGILKAYPSHGMAEQAKKQLAELDERLSAAYWKRALFYDRFGKHPKAALMAYTEFLDNFPQSASAGKARERIAALAPAVAAPEAASKDPAKDLAPENAGAKP